MERLKRTGETFLIPFENIIVDENINGGRLIFEGIEELAASIKEAGLKVPVLVQKLRNEEKYVLVQGKSRYKAIQLLIERKETLQSNSVAY